MLKKIFLFLLTVLCLFVAWQHELIWYGMKQGHGQLKIIRNAVDVEVIMSRDDFPDSLRRKIEVIQKAGKYAVEKLGLNKSENYTTFYDQKGETTLWNLSASKPYFLEPKKWWFPIVGDVPYKGFFDSEEAKEEGTVLAEQEWDVRIRPVNGWSTLGWFKDPILSSMLNRSDGQLAELIIHELVHGTIFVKDEVTFNENIASFIGEQGARQFLVENYGSDSRETLEYIGNEQDSKKFSDHILRGTNTLDSLYRSFDENMEVSKKQLLKEQFISLICESIDTIQFLNLRYYRVFDKTVPNNAYFMSFLRYYSAEDSLETIFQKKYESNLELFVNSFKEEHGS